jgi:hypothetical protein
MPIDALAIASGDRWLVTVSDRPLIWHLGAARLIDLVDRTIGRTLSVAERSGLGIQ